MYLLLFQEPKTTTEAVMLNEVAEQLSDITHQEDLAPINASASGHSPASKQFLSAWAQGGSEIWMLMYMKLLLHPWKSPLLK